jgi:hypothetical protein
MLQITVGEARYQPDDQDDDFLPRTLAGWHEKMTDSEVYDAARGWWKLSLARAEHERFAVVVARGIVRQVIEIHEWRYSGPKLDRYAFSGEVLRPGHAVHDRYIGTSRPSANQNPIRYFDDPDADSLGSPCKCGCGELTRGIWAQGHDHKAIHQRIGRDFNGDVAAFIDWYDGPDAQASRVA